MSGEDMEGDMAGGGDVADDMAAMVEGELVSMVACVGGNEVGDKATMWISLVFIGGKRRFEVKWWCLNSKFKFGGKQGVWILKD